MPQLTTRADSDLLTRIAAELERLRHRVPSLPEADLAAIDDALAQLAERLFLDAIRRRPALHGLVDPILSPLDSRRRAAP